MQGRKKGGKGRDVSKKEGEKVAGEEDEGQWQVVGDGEVFLEKMFKYIPLKF